MKAGVAFRIAAVAAVLAPALASAQQQTQPATPPPAQPAPQTPADTVGPRELRDFSLPGTTTRPAENPPAQQPSTPSEPPPRNQRKPSLPPRAKAPPGHAVQPAEPRGSSVTVALPPRDECRKYARVRAMHWSRKPADSLQSQPAIEPLPVPPAASQPAPADSSNWWLWIAALAVAALGIVAAFLWVRQRRRSVAEVGGALEAFVPPEPR